MHRTISTHRVSSRKGLAHRISPTLAAFLATLLALPVQAGITIPTDPLTTGSRVPPNILFILDDSGSMAPDTGWRMGNPDITSITGGSITSIENTGDNNGNTTPYTGITRNTYVGNTIFYNPAVDYRPWVDASGNILAGGTTYGAAYSSLNVASGGTIDLASATRTYYVPKAGATNLADATQYFRYQIHTDGVIVRSERLYGNAGSEGLTGRDCQSGTTNTWRWKNCTRVTPTGRTEEAERNNFATWYSYHRTRMKVAKAGASQAFSDLGTDVRVGFRTIHNRNTYNIPVNNNNGLFADPNGTGGADNNRTTWFNRLFNAAGSGRTPLHNALNSAGSYFELTDASGPWGPQEGVNQLACRQNFAILTTDGYWNDGNTGYANYDNQDGPVITGPSGATYQYRPGNPYQGADPSTLADVAMRYWNTDLRGDLDNIVPTTTANPAFWQHMVTFGISIGLKGSLNPDTDLPALTAGTRFWPNPNDNEDFHRIDDLFHASVNGRGSFIAAGDPNEFTSGLKAALATITERTGSFSNVAANSARLQTGTKLFQASYVSGVWTGELVAYDRLTPPQTGFAATPTWRSSNGIPATGRKVFTSNGTLGLAFPGSATTAQLSALTRTGTALNFPVTGAQNAAYLAGDRTLELNNGGTLRNRNHLLGDIVSSSPAYVDDTQTLYVGANDGMLHAFNASNGQELFGYIPNIVNWSNLGSLSRPDYAHQYFVDGAIVVSTRKQTPGQNILVGALGRGGKGIFALDVSNPASFGTTNFKWERAETTNNLMGQVLTRPIIAKLNNNVTAVIVANGPNSTAERAALLVYNLDTGALISEIDTGVGSAAAPNGLFAPVGIDQDASGTLDYIYAGDMLGNVWKFNLTSSSPTAWSNAANRTRLFTATSSTGTVQPITGGLTLAMNPSTYKTWVFFGTGRFVTTGDVSDRSVQSLYGIEDNSTTLTRASLTSRKTMIATTKDGQPVRAFEATQALPVTSSGWYIDLVTPPTPPGTAEGERIVTPPQMDGSVLEVSSIIPTSANACQADGRGYLNALDAFTGTSAKKPYFDVDGDGDFSDETVTYTDGSGNTVTVPIGSVDLGVGMVTQGSLFSGNPDDLGLICAGGSAGGLGCRGKNDPRNVGRVSWREIRQE